MALNEKQRKQIRKNAERLRTLLDSGALNLYDQSRPQVALAEVLTALRHYAAWQHLDFDQADAESLGIFKEEIKGLTE